MMTRITIETEHGHLSIERKASNNSVETWVLVTYEESLIVAADDFDSLIVLVERAKREREKPWLEHLASQVRVEEVPDSKFGSQP